MAPAIRASALRKTYDGKVAVEHLDLDVEAGTILGLVGPNGAGKTTTLRCLAGILPPTSGEVQIAGVDVEADPVAAKRNLAFVPDTPHLFDYLSVEDHLRFVGRLHGVEDIETRMAALLEHFELEDKREALPGALSRGMSQKVAIGMAFLHDPRALLLDEPLTGLDPIGIRVMKDAIRARAVERGAAVIVSSHLLELIEEICDEIAIIQDGRLLTRGPLDAIRAEFGLATGEHSLEEVFFRATGHDEVTASPVSKPGATEASNENTTEEEIDHDDKNDVVEESAS